MLILLLTLIISIAKRKKFPQLVLLPFYLFLFLAFISGRYLFEFFFPAEYKPLILQIDKIGNYVITIVEFIAFSWFNYYAVHKHSFRKTIGIISLLAVIFFLFLFIDILRSNAIEQMQSIHSLYIIESILLLLLSSFYFIELFSTLPVDKLQRSANFWIASGLLFYLVVTFPITMISNYLYHHYPLAFSNLYSVIYISYILFFSMILCAYFCNNPKSASANISSANSYPSDAKARKCHSFN